MKSLFVTLLVFAGLILGCKTSENTKIEKNGVTYEYYRDCHSNLCCIKQTRNNIVIKISYVNCDTIKYPMKPCK